MENGLIIDWCLMKKVYEGHGERIEIRAGSRTCVMTERFVLTMVNLTGQDRSAGGPHNTSNVTLRSERQDYVWRQSSDTGIPPMEKAYMEQNDIVTNKEFHKYARYVQHK